MKKRTKRNRVFLNTPATECMAAVGWHVQVHKSWNPEKKTMQMHGEITINQEGQTHYVSRKADLRALYNMRKELDRFINECETALKDVKEHNDGLKEGD